MVFVELIINIQFIKLKILNYNINYFLKFLVYELKTTPGLVPLATATLAIFSFVSLKLSEQYILNSIDVEIFFLRTSL